MYLHRQLSSALGLGNKGFDGIPVFLYGVVMIHGLADAMGCWSGVDSMVALGA